MSSSLSRLEHWPSAAPTSSVSTVLPTEVPFETDSACGALFVVTDVLFADVVLDDDGEAVGVCGDGRS